MELAERDGDPRWAERAATVLNAVTLMARPDGVIPGGFDDGGDGGLFNGKHRLPQAHVECARPQHLASFPSSPPYEDILLCTRP